MNKVYIVTFGRYDDYQILEVFSSEESAYQYLHEYCKKTGWPGPRASVSGRVETWEVHNGNH